MKNTEEILGYKYVDILHYLAGVGLHIVLAIFILLAGFWIANRIGGLVGKVMQKRKSDEGLVTFVSNFSTIASKIIVVITAISQLGIEMTSFVTVLGAAGIAVGMAFSGTLSNFAGGILILVIKPFRVKDTITALLVTGEVTEIQIFNTYIRTPDNKTIVLPNGPLINGTIINFTKEGKRRIDIVFPIKYGTSLEEISLKIKESLSLNPSILQEPEPMIYITDFDEKSCKLNVNCWVKTIHYGKVHKELSSNFFPWLQPIEG